MATITVDVGTTQDYTTAGTTLLDPVTLEAFSTLNVIGTGVNVVLAGVSAVAGSTINVQGGATVTLAGVNTGLLNSFTIGNGGTLNAGSLLTVANPISFTGTSGVLGIAEGVNLLSPLFGFTAGNQIKTAGTISSFNYTPDPLNPTGDGTLSITNTDNTIATQQLDGNYTTASFVIGADGDLNVACYCRGTLIETEIGEVAVEDLQIGDRVVTFCGVARPVEWIGKRSYMGRFLSRNRKILPVVITAGALGGGLPRRDLLISPDHAMFFDGILVPAKALVNGTTILQCRDVDRIDYFHVELATHDVIFAEGAPSETFLDDDSRAMFHNAHEHVVLLPDIRPLSSFCAPRFDDGALLETIRQRIWQHSCSVGQAA